MIFYNNAICRTIVALLVVLIGFVVYDGANAKLEKVIGVVIILSGVLHIILDILIATTQSKIAQSKTEREGTDESSN